MIGKLYKNNRESEVIDNRANGNTLDATGKAFGVTRERIRQIEKNVTRRFESLLNSNRIILKIFAERNGDEILTPSEIAEYFETGTKQVLYLLRKSDTSFIHMTVIWMCLSLEVRVLQNELKHMLINYQKCLLKTSLIKLLSEE